ncbi:hypothetical protein PDESU_00666 [Pontiella desulfatans]|uniref:ABC-three component systems C-terminal domain-containing protein n=1 Tax=Pontiella desulfatans TaxID=2750659 RepID=A0A6C2TXW6_PONDE|nr:ABC-three component system protein [Pontiella desulfatans]VGO12116.1 hypothetical protein PDESU_00666 [Pontiella desulfatans]
MSRFPIHELTDAEFEDLVTLICRELLGAGVTSFAPGKDGGKDAKFVGKASCFPSDTEPAEGKFIIQAKHTSFPSSCSEYDFSTTIINKEIPKIKRQHEDGLLTHYLIFTNRRKTGGAEDKIPQRIKDETGVEHVWLRGLEDIERELLVHSHIVRISGLDKLRSSIQFTPEDIRDVIVQFHEQRDNIPTSFDSQHDFEYPGMAKKNEINGVSEEYYKYICDDSMMHFSDIRAFLKNPRNQTEADQYHAVADELKGQLILHKERYPNFDHALEEVAKLVHQRSPELQPASRRRLSKVLVHYMYVDCDIGEKE